MQKRTRSLLEELDSISLNRDVPHIVESRGVNIISGAINLIELINKHYGKEKAEILEKKLLSAIKNKDKSRFSKSVKRNNESQ